MSKMKDKPYTETDLYKRGKAIQSLGEVLMSEASTMSDVADAASDAGLSLAYAFIPKDEITTP